MNSLKKLCILAAFFCSSAFAQMSSTGAITASGSTCGTTNACIALNLFNSPSLSTTAASVLITGTFSGTIQFEASVDGITFVSIPGAPAGGGASVTSTTGTGTWTFGIAAFTVFRARASAYASGTATITIQASGGSGAGGSIGANATGTVGANAIYTAATGSGITPSQICSDNGVTYTCRAFASSVATGTAPIAVTSTTTVPNLTASNHPKVQFCGTTSTCSATATLTGQVVFGSAALVSGTPSTVTISGISPAFTSNTSYKCTVNDQTAVTNNLVGVTSYASGSSFVITGPATTTDTVVYICVGN